MRHGVPEIEMNDDLNFFAHGPQRQIYRQVPNIVFSNALVETLLIKLGDSLRFLTVHKGNPTAVTCKHRCAQRCGSENEHSVVKAVVVTVLR